MSRLSLFIEEILSEEPYKLYFPFFYFSRIAVKHHEHHDEDFALSNQAFRFPSALNFAKIRMIRIRVLVLI